MSHLWTETYVVSLPRDAARVAGVAAALAGQVGFKVWRAFDGKAWMETTSRRSAIVGRACSQGLTCTPGIVGCYVSHVALWQHVAETLREPGQWVLVLEDDARPVLPAVRSQIHRALQDAVSRAIVPDIVNLADPMTLPVHGTPDVTTEPTVIVMTTCAYLISASGARRLLRAMDHAIHFHVDFVISWHALSGHVRAVRTRSAIFRQSDETSSTVSPKTFPSSIPTMAPPSWRPALAGSVIGIGPTRLNVCGVVLLVVLTLAFPWWIASGATVAIATIVGRHFFLSCFAIETREPPAKLDAPNPFSMFQSSASSTSSGSADAGTTFLGAA